MIRKPWWGEFSFSEELNYSWKTGTREIVIERLKSEWKTWDIANRDEGEHSIEVSLHKAPFQFEDASLLKNTLRRHLQERTSEKLSVLPALADRPMVVRPVTPLRILVGERIHLYLSTPLWFSAGLSNSDQKLLDIPFYRPSDSWFGPSFREGELCYAKYTDARIEFNSLERRQHRAITPIFITNKYTEAIIIERISLPVPLLSLYADEANQLWTNALTITYDADNATALLILGKEAPREAGKAIFISGPRIKAEKNTLVRSISSLFA